MSNDDPYAAVTPAPALAVRSDDLKHGGEMALAFRDPQIGGTNLSPHPAWSGFPPPTQSFALTCYDPDAPTGTGFMNDLRMRQYIGPNPPPGSGRHR